MIDATRLRELPVETGLPWVPVVPTGWRVKPNRAFLRRRKVLVGESHQSYRLLSLTKRGVIVRDISTGKGKFSADMGTSQEVRAGDLVFCLFDVPETPRTVGLSVYDGMITGAYTVFECADPTLARFLEAYYVAMDDRKLLSPLYSGLRNTIPPPRFLGTRTPIPPPDEQAAIVKFIDYADRRIRRYIRAKQKLIKLLEEQKQAIIHQAVTRGLNPDVRLKPSGVPWIGDVPAHWELLPNRAFLRIRKKLVGARHSEFRVLSLTKRGVIVRDMDAGGKYSNFWDRSQEVREGDFVFCFFDVEETPRTVALSRHAGMISGDYTVMECKDRDIAGFVEWFYIAMDDRKMLRPLYSGLRKRIPKPKFLGIPTPMPPPWEMKEIVEAINTSVRVADDSTQRLRQEVGLVEEYRIRLIADVVTGKLDVREAAAALPDELDEDEPELEEPDDELDDDALTDEESDA